MNYPHRQITAQRIVRFLARRVTCDRGDHGPWKPVWRRAWVMVVLPGFAGEPAPQWTVEWRRTQWEACACCSKRRLRFDRLGEPAHAY